MPVSALQRALALISMPLQRQCLTRTRRENRLYRYPFPFKARRETTNGKGQMVTVHYHRIFLIASTGVRGTDCITANQVEEGILKSSIHSYVSLEARRKNPPLDAPARLLPSGTAKFQSTCLNTCPHPPTFFYCHHALPSIKNFRHPCSCCLRSIFSGGPSLYQKGGVSTFICLFQIVLATRAFFFCRFGLAEL